MLQSQRTLAIQQFDFHQLKYHLFIFDLFAWFYIINPIEMVAAYGFLLGDKGHLNVHLWTFERLDFNFFDYQFMSLCPTIIENSFEFLFYLFF